MTPEIKQRIEQIRRGEVPEGYKKTKAGIVPSVWDVTKLSSISSHVTKKNADGKVKTTFTNSATQGVIKQTDYFDKEISNKENITGYYVVQENDYIYNPRISVSAPCGPINKSHFKEPGVVSPLYTVFKMNDGLQKNRYIEFYLKSSFWHRYMCGVANYGARHDRMNITNEDLFAMPIPFPTLAEQEKIAEILSTQDKLIELKEKLVEEKKKQKKALMQQLLTGKKRLPGFSDEWHTIVLSQISKKAMEKNTGFKFDIVFSNSAQNGIVPQVEQFDKDIANDDNIDRYYIVTEGCFVYNPRISVTAPCGPINVNHNKTPGVMSPLYTIFYINSPNVDNDYLEQYFKSTIWFKYMKSVANYGARHDRMSVTDNDFFNMPIKISDLKEQTAIKNILICADQEIELFKKELDQEKQKKEALMQLLLTGIVRVNI